MKTDTDSCVAKQIRIRKQKCRFRTIMLAGAFKVACMVTLGVVLFNLAFGMKTVEGNDMYPAIRDGDVVVYYRHADYMNNDAVMLLENNKNIVGRIQATSGSMIAVTDDNQITVDGNIQPVQARAGIFSSTKSDPDSNVCYPLEIGSDEYFILGDNRESAYDSRNLGSIRSSDIKGKVFIVIRRRSI